MTAFTTCQTLLVRDLGRVPYDRAFALQRQLQREVIGWREEAKQAATVGNERRGGEGDAPRSAVGHLLLLEHDPPVITLSRRAGSRQHLIATEQQLRADGIEVAETDRGGDITYHGPGQLVVYPILDLNRLGLRIHSYMRLLEDIVIAVLARHGITGVRDVTATGVWLPGGGKICAMGVRISKWVSMHGLALNVSPNMRHFDHIVPCGLAGRTVTSMREQLGEACPGMDEVKRTMVEAFCAAVEDRLIA